LLRRTYSCTNRRETGTGTGKWPMESE
jgi:hypothetical protein